MLIWRRYRREGHAGMSIGRVMQNPIPFLISLCLILLTIWLLRWFKDR